MATRLDRVTTSPDRSRRASARRAAESGTRGSVAHEGARAGTPERLGELGGERELPVRALGGAMAAWLALTFGLCYVVLPAIAAITGVNPGLINTFWFDLPSFAIVSFVTIVAALVERPRIDLSKNARSPVLAAMLGGLGVWAVVHNTSPFLVPFADMSAVKFTSLLGINIIETGMIGMMLASLTKRADVALALGGGFQLGLLGLLLTFLTLAVG